MKLSPFRVRYALAIILMISVWNLDAQLRSPFQSLEPSTFGSNFFFPQSYNTIPALDPASESNVLNASQCASLFMSFSRAALDSTLTLSDFSQFREFKDSVAHREGCYSLALLDVLYDDFRADALTSGLVYREAGEFYHTPGCQASPCMLKEALVLWVDAPHVQSKVYRFQFEEHSWVSNYELAADSVQIDFDDGLGYRPLVSNEIYAVDYSGEASDRYVRCRLWRNGYAMKQSTCVLKSSEEFDPCALSTFPYPHPAPWTTDENHPWDIHLSIDAGEVEGRAYTLSSDDGVFDKPFVFVEGIDFGLDRDGHFIHEEHRHGTFGWCEFTSGFQDPDVSDDFEYGYDNLRLMPELLNQLRAHGYDLVLVDFYDGAAELPLNAQLVEEVLRLCNAHKQGSEPLVVAGASMGGVLSRYALRDMELNGEDPCTRLWISFDAPHKGAHIPRALQEAIKFSFEHGGESAQLFRDRFLLRPAAKQLLDVQVFNDMVEFNDWYGLLDEMGYPTSCRSIAISNGRSNGQGLEYAIEPLLDWDCQVTGYELAEYRLYDESGNSNHPWSLAGFNVLAEFTQPTVGISNFGDELYYWLGGLYFGLIDLVDIDHDIVYTPASTPNRDYAPGGKRNTIQTLARAISNERIQLFDSVDFENPCPDVQPNEYNRDHAFVLTSSAVGISSDNPYVNVDQYLDEHPEEDYFDRVWFAPLQNENHTELTEQNLMFVLDEVIGADVAGLDTSLSLNSPNNGVFNYGRPEFAYLRDIHVHSGGRLYFNAYMPTHFDAPSDYLSTEFNFEVNTLDCVPAIVRVDHDGLMQLGDPTAEYRTAQLTVGRDSRIEIGAGGILRICEGSMLILEEGAILEIQHGGRLEIRSGHLMVRSGAEVRFSNGTSAQFVHEVVLSGTDARMVFDGGLLSIAARTTLAMSEDSEFTGYMEVIPGSENVLHMDTLSLFHWKGRSADDLILRIVNGAHLQNAEWALGSIVLEDGLVDLTYNGAIYTDALFSAKNVAFYASDQWEAEGSEVWIWMSQCTIDSCRFEHVDLHAINSKSEIKLTEFIGPNAGFHAEEGACMVTDCAFQQAKIHTDQLMADFSVKRSVFTQDSYIYDTSAMDVVVEECSFSDGSNYAIEKSGAELHLRCNDFDDIEGVYMHQGSVNMSSLNGSGYNFFSNVPVCVTCDEVIDIKLGRGYNDFSGYQQFVFAGVIDTTCSIDEGCELILDGNYNHWGGAWESNALSSEYVLVYPSPLLFDLFTIETAICNPDESDAQCTITVEDIAPILIKECPEGMPELERRSVYPPEATHLTSTVRIAEGRIIINAQEPILTCTLYDVMGRKLDVSVLATSSEKELHIDGSDLVSSACYLLVIETPVGREVFRKFFE